MTQNTDYVFGVSWYGDDASIAQTGYIFASDEAMRMAKEGAEAPTSGHGPLHSPLP